MQRQLCPLLAQTVGTVSAYRVANCRVVLLDHTGFARPSARTVAERERYVGPNDTRAVGHRSSFLTHLLVDADSSWLAPLDVERSGPGSTPVGIGLTQVARLAQASDEPLIAIADREYGVNDVLRVVPQLPGVPVTFVARGRCKLVCSQPPPPRLPGQRGAARTYGARIHRNDPATWPEPAWQTEERTASGARVALRGWAGWVRRGLPDQPVQVVQVQVLSPDGQPKYRQPLWLLVCGSVTSQVVWHLYPRRWREETLHRQVKDLFGWCRAQWGSIERQDRWTWVVLLATWPLLLARDVAQDGPRAWERARRGAALPLAWQFQLARPPPKPRSKAPGRAPGMVLAPKPRQPVLKRRLGTA
jgi:hypothetical protein